MTETTPTHRIPRYSAAAVSYIAPVDGWSLLVLTEHDSDGFSTPLYIARSAAEDIGIHHCRFHFTPTQARFAWLVRNGFPGRAGVSPSWTDADLDAAIAAAPGAARIDRILSCENLIEIGA